MYADSISAQAATAHAPALRCNFDPAEANPDLDLLEAARQLQERGARFVCWQHETVDGEPRKIPKRTFGGNASSTSPATWASLGQCLEAVEPKGFTGVGFILAAERDLEAGWVPIVGIDLDGCRDPGTGELEPWAREIVRDFTSYTEVSPSGTGVKLLAMVDKTTGLRGGKKVIQVANGKGRNQQVGIYTTGRYLAMTWEHLDGTPDEIVLATEAYERLLAELPAPRPKAVDVDVELGDVRGEPSPETIEVIENVSWIGSCGTRAPVTAPIRRGPDWTTSWPRYSARSASPIRRWRACTGPQK